MFGGVDLLSLQKNTFFCNHYHYYHYKTYALIVTVVLCLHFFK